MDAEFLEEILKLHLNPSTKLGLICLANANEPMTTRDLNVALSVSKTFQNYQDLFKEQISNGSITLVDMKSKNGITRKHFSLELDKLLDD